MATSKNPADQLTFSFDEVEEERDPLTDRIVCMLGTFRQSVRTLQDFFQKQGAEFRPLAKPSRNVHYVLMGEDPPVQYVEYLHIMAFHGFCPRLLFQSDIDTLLAGGDISQYVVSKDIGKNLKLTYQHYELFQVCFSVQKNPLYTHELFVPSDTLMPTEELYLLLGSRGVYANNYLDEFTDTILLSDASIEHLRRGETDETIRYIEKMYNNSKSQFFRYSILSESDIITAFS